MTSGVLDVVWRSALTSLRWAVFSFGPIKTATALRGAVLRVRDRAVLERMRAAHAQYPRATQGAFAKRIGKYSALKALTWRPVYSAFVRINRARGRPVDDVIQRTVRGFPGGEFFANIRHRPSTAMYSLLARRLERCDGARIAERARLGDELARAIGDVVLVPGMRAPLRTHWVFTVVAERADEFVALLRAEGFDGTRVATLTALPVPPSRPDADPRESRSLVQSLVYLPLYPELGEATRARLARIVRKHAQSLPEFTPAAPSECFAVKPTPAS